MQPYMFAYWPYFQLIACVDKFVILDTVQFISRGHARRNSILVNGKAKRFTLPVTKHKRATPFSEITFSATAGEAVDALSELLCTAYRHRPFPSAPKQLLLAAFPHNLNYPTPFSMAFMRTLNYLLGALDIKTEILKASDLRPRQSEKAEDYLMDIVLELEGEHYINPIGGSGLYSAAAFKTRGLKLSFLSSCPLPYDQGQSEFVDNLSILDLVANLDTSELKTRLCDFAFLSAD